MASRALRKSSAAFSAAVTRIPAFFSRAGDSSRFNHNSSTSGDVPPYGRRHDMLPPFTSAQQVSESHPLVISRSYGVYVEDSQGKVYIDALAGLWSTALGGSEQRLIDAATRQMETLPFYHSFWNRTTEPALALAKKLTDMFTASKMGQVFFTNSGSEANDSQVKLVWYYNNALGRPEKKKFIARSKGYHGSTLVSAGLTGLPNMHHSFDLPLPFIHHTDCPHFFKNALPGESEEEFSARLADNLDQLIQREGAHTVAAFIAEPVMGAGGVIPPPRGYFQAIQPVLKKHDVLLIADEVVCGFGRLGSWFGSDLYGMQPDLVTLAKALSSAYQPIGAVLIRDELAHEISAHSNRMGSFGHGFTYSGHPVACAVALESLTIYQEMQLPERVKELEPLFQGGMRFICRDSPIVGEVRGLGLIIGVEFMADKESRTPFPADWTVGPFFGRCAANCGLLVRTVGDTICMSPALTVNGDEINMIVTRFQRALHETEDYVFMRQSGNVNSVTP